MWSCTKHCLTQACPTVPSIIIIIRLVLLLVKCRHCGGKPERVSHAYFCVRCFFFLPALTVSRLLLCCFFCLPSSSLHQYLVSLPCYFFCLPSFRLVSLSALLFFCLPSSSPRQSLELPLCSACCFFWLPFSSRRLVSLFPLLFLLLAFLFASSVSLFCCFFACLSLRLPSHHSWSNCCWVTSIRVLHTSWGSLRLGHRRHPPIVKIRCTTNYMGLAQARPSKPSHRHLQIHMWYEIKGIYLLIHTGYIQIGKRQQLLGIESRSLAPTQECNQPGLQDKYLSMHIYRPGIKY